MPTRTTFFFLTLGLAFWLFGASLPAYAAFTPTPTDTETPTVTETPTATDTATPTATFTITRTPVQVVSLLQNGAMTGTGAAPDGWSYVSDWQNHAPDTVYYRGSSGNGWRFWAYGGTWQDAHSGFAIGDTLHFGGYLYMPSGDPLRDGTKFGRITCEFWGTTTTPISIANSVPDINRYSPQNTWNFVEEQAVVPPGTIKIRLIVYCAEASSGDGIFTVDDTFMDRISYTFPTATSTITPTHTPTPIFSNLTPTQTPVNTSQFRRGSAWPNPFLPGRGQKVTFATFPAADGAGTIRIVTSRGQRVRTLDGLREWDGRDDAGRNCEGGLYFYQIKTNQDTVNGSVVLIR